MLSAGPEGAELMPAFAAAIEKNGALKAMRPAVADTARSLWSWANAAAQYEHIYEGLLQ
jgi:hypothetical protein